MPGLCDCPTQFLLTRGIGDLHHRALPPPSFTSISPAPLVSSPGVVGGFGVPHPGHPSSASPNSPHNTFLCLSHYLPLPQAPMATTGPACFPRDSLGQSGRPLGAPSLSKEVCPPGLRDSQTMRGPRSQATALSHHGLGSAAADGHRCPGPSVPTQRRQRAPSFCHHPHGRDPGSHPSPACSCHYCSSSRAPFPRGSSPLRPVLLVPGAPR